MASQIYELPARVPPHDMAAEWAVLSVCLGGEVQVASVRQSLRSDEFYSDANRKVFEAMVGLDMAGRPVDVLTVRGYLDDMGWLQRVGGSKYLAEILDSVPTVANVDEYVRLIKDKATLRNIISIGQQIQAEGYSCQCTERLLSESVRSLSDISPSSREPIATITTEAVFEPQTPIPWVVAGIYLAPGRPSLVAGYGYSAKSVSCQALLLAVASGRPVWGKFQVARPLTVLHLDHEQGKRATVLRYQRLARAMGISRFDLGNRLKVAPLPARFRLSNDDAESVLERACQGVAVCLIDSLRATTPNVDENDSMIREHLDKLLRVSEKTGTAFVVIHHAGKNGKEKDAREKSRGSSAIFDACGLVLQLDGKLNDDGTTIVSVKMTKAPADASGAAVQPFSLKVADVMDDDGADERWGLGCSYQSEGGDFDESSVSDKFLKTKSDVLRAVRANPMIGGADAIRARVGARATDVRQAVRELLDDGEIENVGAANRPKYRVVYNSEG